MQSYHDWYVEEITELEDLTIGMWSEPLKIAKWFFHLSYLYLSFTCLIISLVVGLLVSVLTGNKSLLLKKIIIAQSTWCLVRIGGYNGSSRFKFGQL